MLLRSEALFGFGAPSAADPRVIWCPQCKQLVLGLPVADGRCVVICGSCLCFVAYEQGQSQSINGSLASRKRELVRQKKSAR